MRIFITGASGFIGEKLTRELIEHGHQVVGLARNAESAAKIEALGAEARRGDLTDPAGLAEAAAASDGVVHLAYNHDFSRFQQSGEEDLAAIEAMLAALAGSGKPFVGTSGTGMIRKDGPIVETDAVRLEGFAVARGRSEIAVIDAARNGVRSAVVRLPQVHDTPPKGFVPWLVAIAREKGVAAYIGEGANRWPTVHRMDAVRLYRLALEKAPPGTVLHAVGEEGVALRTIAETIAEGLGVPARSIAAEEAEAHFGWLGHLAGADNAASSAITQRTLDWHPREIGMIEDMRASGYWVQADY